MKRKVEELEKGKSSTALPVDMPDTPDQSSTKSDEGGIAKDFGSLTISASSEGHYLGPGSGISFAQLTQAIMFQKDFEKEKTIAGGLMLHTNPALMLDNASNPEDGPLPSAKRAAEVVEFYWCHSHTLYPILDKDHFMECLDKMFSLDDEDVMGLHNDSVWMFKLYMVLAIGSTAMASITISSENEAVACWSKAMTYFNDTLSKGNIAALECLLLLVSYSFFNRLGPDTWYLVGIASRLALGLGWHSEKSLEAFPPEQRERYKRVFWSLYMMDRVVSTTLGRPLAIRDQDIDTNYFSVVGQPYLEVTLHILKLRQIAGQILENVYTIKTASSATDQTRHSTVNHLHHQLVEWRRTMPFPLNESQFSLVPHLTTAWFDLNYYNLVIMLFRPSPLWPMPPQENIRLVADAAAMALQQFSNLCRQQKLSFNWLNLISVFTAGLTLVFITTQPDWQTNYLPAREVINDLKVCRDLLTKFAQRLPPAKACVNVITGSVHDLCSKHDSNEPSPIMQNDENANPTYSVDSVLQMFSMSNDRYYEELMAQIDPSFMADTPFEIDTTFWDANIYTL
ncbi:hypothetical protein TRICI_006767 [Trichomonascus ciferrii]|uniref:Xylanolytic transcriptional activator regulatory domain-containing protein n=1 Tax=Trichomonascus ciferrii TaxID=44093 RepID=A0A642UDP9_9ASCO|nr:hypothetical protein TRICI_006767 [Trichomonascus ciferrii]